MTVDQLAAMLGCDICSSDDRPVKSVTQDSRRVTPGSVFCALEGTESDGHRFARAAVDNGAVAIMGERTGLDNLEGVPYLRVREPRRVLGKLAHRLAGDPSRAMVVVGITGTNGKTSTVSLTKAALAASGCNTAAFGTLGYEIGDDVHPARHTTPFAEDLAGMFLEANGAGMSHVVMEASSHALEQDRVAGIDFDVAAFTNLTQDHLDYHENMGAYLAAKLKLFESVRGPGRFTVVNAADSSAAAFKDASKVPCYSFGEGGDCRAENVHSDGRENAGETPALRTSETRFAARTPWGDCVVTLHLRGDHNIANALCALTICGGLGVPVERAAEGISSLESVPGRFESVDLGQDFQVVVDYAHTEDGLRNVLEAARRITSGRIIVVFGCGGDRDKTKRPKMGMAAGRLADFAVITSDNPRTEDPYRIIDEIEPGMEHAGKKKDVEYRVIVDRKTAIYTAIGMARTGDLVMIAGKGHEDYQILGTRRIHFDDREVARAALGELQRS